MPAIAPLILAPSFPPLPRTALAGIVNFYCLDAAGRKVGAFKHVGVLKAKGWYTA